jgi:hypothetical protein
MRLVRRKTAKDLSGQRRTSRPMPEEIDMAFLRSATDMRRL